MWVYKDDVARDRVRELESKVSGLEEELANSRDRFHEARKFDDIRYRNLDCREVVLANKIAALDRKVDFYDSKECVSNHSKTTDVRKSRSNITISRRNDQYWAQRVVDGKSDGKYWAERVVNGNTETAGGDTELDALYNLLNQ